MARRKLEFYDMGWTQWDRNDCISLLERLGSSYAFIDDFHRHLYVLEGGAIFPSTNMEHSISVEWSYFYGHILAVYV